MHVEPHDVLRWLHVIAMAYWLGGEWGVFNASREVVNPKLSYDERLRHMETAFRIDILARTGIILLLPLGLQMGYDLGAQPLGGPWIIGMWVFVGCWLALTWTAFFTHKSDFGVALTKIDEALRYIIIPLLLAFGLASLVMGEPFTQGWYAAKVTIFAGLLIIGLLLRYVMRDWITAFRTIGLQGSTPAVEGKLSSAMSMARKLAYLYWFGIASVAFLGVVKPF